MIDFQVSELNRRIANLIRIAKVIDVDVDRALVKVVLGEIESDWLPWLSSRAGDNRSWSVPDKGEQVMLLAPSGDLSQSVILCALFQDKSPPPEADGDVHSMTYKDGSKISYNRKTHKLEATLSNEGSASITAKKGLEILATEGGVKIKGDTTITGNVNITGDIVIKGKLNASGVIESDKDVVGNSVSLVDHGHTLDIGKSKTTKPKIIE